MWPWSKSQEQENKKLRWEAHALPVCQPMSSWWAWWQTWQIHRCKIMQAFKCCAQKGISDTRSLQPLFISLLWWWTRRNDSSCFKVGSDPWILFRRRGGIKTFWGVLQFNYYAYNMAFHSPRDLWQMDHSRAFPKIFSTAEGCSSPCLCNRNALQLKQNKDFATSGYQIGNSMARQWRLTWMVFTWFIFRDGIYPNICAFPQGEVPTEQFSPGSLSSQRRPSQWHWRSSGQDLVYPEEDASLRFDNHIPAPSEWVDLLSIPTVGRGWKY